MVEISGYLEGEEQLTARLNSQWRLKGNLNYLIDGYVHPKTHDYVTEIANKPRINTVELVGDKSLPEIGVDSLSNFDIENMLI
jgi:hypothetical protein